MKISKILIHINTRKKSIQPAAQVDNGLSNANFASLENSDRLVGWFLEFKVTVS